MSTRLERYKVQNFRSIEESDWIELSDNSCLVGTNEAGKTNLLIALWKLNPANNEPIVPLDDFPRHLYSNYKADNHSEDVFVSADFILDSLLQKSIADELSCDIEQVKKVLVRRMYSGKYYITFPYSQIDSFPTERLKSTIESFNNELSQNDAFTKEGEKLQAEITKFLSSILEKLKSESIDLNDVEQVITDTNIFIESKFGKKKNLP